MISRSTLLPDAGTAPAAIARRGERVRHLAAAVLVLLLAPTTAACGMFASRDLDAPPEPAEIESDVSDPFGPSVPEDVQPPTERPPGPSDSPDATVIPSADPTEVAWTCGGPAVLVHEGAPARPFDPCGPGDGGVLVCDGTHALRCRHQSVETPTNACGGTAVLHHEPEAPCGCGGLWLCNTEGTLSCVGATAPNACGGCAPLDAPDDALPGAPCTQEQGDGTWVCEQDGSLACAPREVNACGGAGLLLFGANEGLPGDPCEAPCGPGVLSCASANTLECRELVAPDGSLERNACDGCTFLPQAPGAACGCFDSGRWQCGRDGGLVCAPVADEVVLPDACGECTNSPLRPGAGCGDEGEGRESGVWLCGDGGFACAPAATLPTMNRCGGQEALEGLPGEACGTCALGRWRCAGPDAVECVGDALDACGGCDARVSLQPGDRCAEGPCTLGVAACEGSTLVCRPEGSTLVPNECGGCGPLVEPVGVPCGPCKSWQCADGLGTVRCLRDDLLPGCDD